MLGVMEGSMLLLTAVVLAIPMWRICVKAGYSGWLGLLALVPVANLVLLYFLAFASWPAGRARSGE